MLETISSINSTVNGIVWGVPAMVLIFGVGLYLSIRTGFLQFRKFGTVWQNTIGKLFHRSTEAGRGAVTPFQAVCTALAATVGTGNIAGVKIPVFKELEFKPIVYDLNAYPLWVDKGLSALRDVARYDALVRTLEQQVDLLGKELRTTTQRVNLFEKVKIPQAKENIRRIGIYLGDQQTSAVVRGKIAKKKLVREA